LEFVTLGPRVSLRSPEDNFPKRVALRKVGWGTRSLSERPTQCNNPSIY
jgi:hypothetical protein